MRKLEKAYEKQFKAARGSRVLWIDTSNVDFVANSVDLDGIISILSQPWKVGVHHVAP